MKRGNRKNRLKLSGVGFASSQVWGSIRLVPVVRAAPPGDLRMDARSYQDDVTIVSLQGELMDEGLKYTSYVPHGLVVRWTEDGLPAASFGAELHKADGKRLKKLPGVRVAHRMAKKEGPNQLRLLPLHLAMEGFLSLHFGGPEVAWSEYSRQAISRGLDPRRESSVSGRWLQGLQDALRLFEIHENQVGSLIFVADALASAFIVSHPADYRRLHNSLLQDFYGELLYQYSFLDAPASMRACLNEHKIESIADLERGLAGMRTEWAAFGNLMADGLLSRHVNMKRVYKAGPFQLSRFMTELVPSEENHIGEGIFRDDGTVEYLKTYRLSAAQTRRAFLLSTLAEFHWNIDAAAASERQSRND
ncbi:MAG: hypothetical protein AAFP04_07910, partial [Myxococcota bacterium]